MLEEDAQAERKEGIPSQEDLEVRLCMFLLQYFNFEILAVLLLCSTRNYERNDC